MRVLREEQPHYPYLVPNTEFGAKEQREVVLLIKALMKKEGMVASGLCTQRRLSVSLSEIPAGLGPGHLIKIFSVVIAVAQHMKEVYDVRNDFAFLIDFWAAGSVETTLGKAIEFSRKMATRSVAPGELLETFEFRIW
jgi:hypothetical protein